MPTCGRCAKQVTPDQSETCWWCLGDLCPECWDAYGHCGHDEADEQNERARKVPQPKGHPNYREGD